MTYSFRKAALSGVGVFIAIACSSRTGKTYTALRLARGLAGPGGRTAAIDTEGKRMSHYSDQFDFDVFDMPGPFNGSRFVEAARGAQEEGYNALVIDSFSLEWSGVGGVLAEHAAQWKAEGYNQKKSDQIWNRVKGPGSEHKLMMDSFLQLTIPIIFCIRAHEVAEHLGGGWKIDQDKRFMFEWTVGLTLHPDTPGMPRYDMVDAKRKPLWKVSDIHRHLFPEGKLIGEDAGAGLAAWRNSGEARALGSGAVEKKRTIADWLADLESDLDDMTTREAVEARAGRDDVIKALALNKPETTRRINDLIGKAMARTEPEKVPSFAVGAMKPAQDDGWPSLVVQTEAA